VFCQKLYFNYAIYQQFAQKSENFEWIEECQNVWGDIKD
jgi:hypothetical protein